MKKMYRGVTNSPKTELVTLITETDTEIEVNDISVLLPNEGIAVIGNGDVAETIKYSQVEGNILKDCIRGYEGIARSWTAGTRVARNFTAGDWNTAIDNVEDLYGRIDDDKTLPLTLQPGLQVVTAAKSTRFKLGQITGKTEINGQGRIGIIGVENPYVISTSDNLLPPFYEWANTAGGGATYKINSPYAIEQRSKDIDNYANSIVVIPVIPGQTYTLSADIVKNPENIPDALFFYWLDANRNRLPGEGEGGANRKYKGTYTVPSDAHYMQMYVVMEVVNDNATYKTQTVTNSMLVLGSKAKSFQTQRKSMLAFQTELHANPTDGSEPNALFEQNGQYFKLAKWGKVVLDGTLPWVHDYGTVVSGSKVLFVRDGTISAQNFISFVTKYDGTLLINRTEVSFTGPGQSLMYLDGIHVAIANTDSGWGPDYNPTQDEIKAYFNGWRMCDLNTSNIYTGSVGEVKCWGPITNPSNYLGSGGWADITTNLPTGLAPVSAGYVYHPYNLLYRLAKETVETVTSEGCLTLAEGDNMVEVGTGIVLRERARLGNFPSIGGYWYIAVDGTKLPGGASEMKYKTDKILSVYRDNRSDNTWTIDNNGSASNAYGNARAYKVGNDTDIGYSYSVTYTKLDKSPIQPITGTLAANEKAQISDLTAGVAEALQRVSVVEQKKAEKDAPGWITPTFLNQWTPIGDIYPSGYKKVNDTLKVSMLLTGGAAVAGLTIFRLPEGYRPKKTMVLSGFSRNADATIAGAISFIIEPTGAVNIGFGPVQSWQITAYFEFDV